MYIVVVFFLILVDSSLGIPPKLIVGRNFSFAQRIHANEGYFRKPCIRISTITDFQINRLSSKEKGKKKKGKLVSQVVIIELTN